MAFFIVRSPERAAELFLSHSRLVIALLRVIVAIIHGSDRRIVSIKRLPPLRVTV